jgi:hypothetical protein
MGLFSFIGDIFKPAADLVDNLNTSDEERITLRNEFKKIEQTVVTKLIDLEKAKLDAMQKIQVAEAQSKHWLQGNWRPMCSVTLLALVVGGSFSWFTLDPKVYDIAMYFLGLYGTGRSLEKSAAALKIGK